MLVIKRDGREEEFGKEKIALAIVKALKETTLSYDGSFPLQVGEEIFQELKAKKIQEIFIEDLQDMVEIKLMQAYPQAAKKYILYREERKKQWADGWQMTDLQKDIYESKYRQNQETFLEFSERVSNGNRRIQKALLEKKFIPAGRILAGRGMDEHGFKMSLSNCYALPIVEDSIENIFDTAKMMAKTYSSGGGVGINLSKLRPRGAKVHNAARSTTGAVSFMELYALVTTLIAQMGRRGALMILLDIKHPDIEEFIEVKNDLDKVLSANISIIMSNEFLEAASNGEDFELYFKIGPSGEEIYKTLDAQSLLKRIAGNIWNMAEPGLVFWDNVNAWHLKSEVPGFEFAGCNPCSEQMLPPFGACCLSSINLSEFIKHPFTEKAYFDFDDFKQIVEEGVIFLNDILDEGMELHPLPEQSAAAAHYREIGLGLMGVADTLIKMGIRYGSSEAFNFLDKIMEVMRNTAISMSAALADDQGPAPAYCEEILKSTFFLELPKEIQAKVKKFSLRNTQLLTMAPTGSIGTMIGCSTGIEPLFQVSYQRRTLSINDGQETSYTVFSGVVKELMETLKIKDEADLPDYIVTAHDLNIRERIMMQASIQHYVDAAISSTINLKEEATPKEIVEGILLANHLGLKGVTFYRENCARTGILTNLKEEEEENDTCPDCGGIMMHMGGCSECQECGFSLCSL